MQTMFNGLEVPKRYESEHQNISTA